MDTTSPAEWHKVLKANGLPIKQFYIERELNSGTIKFRAECEHLGDPSKRVTLTYRIMEWGQIWDPKVVLDHFLNSYRQEVGVSTWDGQITFTTNTPYVLQSSNTTWGTINNGLIYNGDPRDEEIRRLKAELDALKGETVKAEEQAAVDSIMDTLVKRTKESM